MVHMIMAYPVFDMLVCARPDGTSDSGCCSGFAVLHDADADNLWCSL